MAGEEEGDDVTVNPMPKPSASASTSQPMTMSERIPSIRYDTGLSVATVRNHSISIRFRGMAMDDRKRKTKNTGNRLWTASPEPVRSAAKAPRAPNPIEIRMEKAMSTTAPAGPVARRTPTSSPTPR